MYTNEYCPLCGTVRQAYELFQAGESLVRCSVCGFPMRGASAPRRGVQAPEVDGPPQKVLCIDASSSIVQILTAILQENGFVPLSAPDGPTGLARALAERPALILLDPVLPGLDGFAVCRRLQADGPTQAIPVILLTGHADPQLQSKAFQAGAALALPKPVDPGQLIATVRATLALTRGRAPGAGGRRGGREARASGPPA